MPITKDGLKEAAGLGPKKNYKPLQQRQNIPVALSRGFNSSGELSFPHIRESKTI